MSYNLHTFGESGETYEPCNILWGDDPWKGRVLFTGPDGLSDHRVTVEEEHRYVGTGTMSVEGTSEADYLWRPAPDTPFQPPKSSKVGEVGWGVPERQDWAPANTVRQIMLGQFRQELEDRHSHLYQNPWYPGPTEILVPGSDAALVMDVYRDRKRQENKRTAGETSQSEGSNLNPGDRTRNRLHEGRQ